MGLRKTAGYQDIEGDSRNELPDPDLGVAQEIEMASVSVVPDGIKFNEDIYECILQVCFIFKIHLQLHKL